MQVIKDKIERFRTRNKWIDGTIQMFLRAFKKFQLLESVAH